jgi:NDP-sugar pyrophosphorylase family protein
VVEQQRPPLVGSGNRTRPYTVGPYAAGVAVVGVIPAAGFATRLGPLPCSKEVYPVGGRPVIDYLVERMRAAPCSEIRVVTRPEKRDVVERARALGATVVEGRPRTVAASVLLAVAGLRGDDVALLGFPDTVWEPVDGFATLLGALGPGIEVVLGCFRSSELERSDVVLAEDGAVRAVQVKPARPASDLVWGCCAARARALGGLRDHAEPGQLFDALARTGNVRAVRFAGEFLDIGTPEALESVAAPA